jgi:hypothetical protein
VNSISDLEKLRALPRVEQARVVSWVEGLGEAAASKRILPLFGLHLTRAELTAFSAWFHLPLSLESAAGFANGFQQNLASSLGLIPSDHWIASAGQIVFERLALETRDSKLFALMRHLSRQDHARSIEAGKLALLEKRAARAEEAGKTLPECKLSNEEKQAKIREFFALDDREDQS